MSNEKAHPKAVVISVAITAIADLIVFILAWSYAVDRHRMLYQLPERRLSGFFGSYTEPAEVSFSELDSPVIIGLLLVSILYPIVHVLVGRVVSAIIYALCDQVGRVFHLIGEGEDSIQWPVELSMVTGALWPLTFILIPFLLIALLFGALYRSVWNA